MPRTASPQAPVLPRRRTRPEPVDRPASRLGRRILRAILALGAAVLLIDALFGDRGLLETLQARRQHDRIAAALAELRDDNVRLREEARRLREDPAAIEELARRELGLIRPGEVLFIVRDEPARPGLGRKAGSARR